MKLKIVALFIFARCKNANCSCHSLFAFSDMEAFSIRLKARYDLPSSQNQGLKNFSLLNKKSTQLNDGKIRKR